MKFTRRDALALGLGATAASFLPLRATAAADDAIAAFTGGAEVGSGGLTLTAPEIAENGNTVPIAVDAPGSVSVLVLAMGNPNPDVATFNFGPLAGAQSASTPYSSGQDPGRCRCRQNGRWQFRSGVPDRESDHRRLRRLIKGE